MINRIILLLALCICNQSNSKILFISAAYNRPDLIELLHRCLNKFVEEDFELVIFNDAEEEHFKKSIEYECLRLRIKHVPIVQNLIHKNHQESVPAWKDVFSFHSKDGQRYPYRVNFREGEVIQHAFELLGFNHNDIVVNIDLDCFPIRPVSIRSKMNNHLIAGYKMPTGWNRANMPQGEGLLPILMAFDMPNLPHKEAIKFSSGFVGTHWFDLCGLLQFYTYCHDIKVEDWCKLGHVHCSKLGMCYSREELAKMGYSATTIDFVKNYYQKLFVELGYTPQGIECDNQCNKKPGKIIFDLGQIMDKDFFHFNQCTNWMGAYDDVFIKAKSELVRNFIFSIT